MLGGPQAGIILGKKALVDRLRAHPLMRALRVDKLTYAALEGTLLEHHAGRAHHTVPVLRMLHASKAAVTARADALADALRTRGWQSTVIDGESAVGGGSAPAAWATRASGPSGSSVGALPAVRASDSRARRTASRSAEVVGPWP